MPAKTRNGFDLIRVLGRLKGEVPVGREVIASSDNLSARTSEEVIDWLAEHPRWRFVFTLKHSSMPTDQAELRPKACGITAKV